MSHGGGGDDKCDVNLTPLLDVVLQLLMFFMMCVNFVNEQVSGEIQLPESMTAMPMEKGEVEVLFLNVNGQGALEVGDGDEPKTSEGEIKSYLRTQYNDTKRADELKGGKGDVKTAIIIRADKDASFKSVYQLMRYCKDIGYTKLQLRAKQKVDEPS